MDNTGEKARRFRQLHESGIFVIPNVWDGGSAKVMAGLGFPALATSSSACAATLGKLDGGISREEALAHARLIASVVAIPVAADLENGFGAAPKDAAETIRRAGEAGVAGGSIEGSSGDRSAPIYDFNHAVERGAAAVGAAPALPFSLPPPARAGNRPDRRAG